MVANIRRMFKIQYNEPDIRHTIRRRRKYNGDIYRHLSSGDGSSGVERDTSDVGLYLAMATLIDRY